MAMNAELCSPSPEIVTSPNKWKILELDKKPKQTEKKWCKNIQLSFDCLKILDRNVPEKND